LFTKSIANHPIISDFRYPSDLLFLVHKNVDRISFGLLIICSLLLFVAIGLINNTIRLRVYAQRFLIRTMQLIGASHSFVRRPFLLSSLLLGFVSGCIAVIAMAGSLHLFYSSWPEAAQELIDIQQDLQLYILMIVLGVLITWGSTFLAVSRFLKLKTEKLYY
jgi:cell division transport system permease protein